MATNHRIPSSATAQPVSLAEAIKVWQKTGLLSFGIPMIPTLGVSALAGIAIFYAGTMR